MLKLQSILLSLILVTFSSVALSADELLDSAAVTDASDMSNQNTENDDNIMIRQSEPIKGFQLLMVTGQEVEATYLEETLGETRGAILLLHDLGEDFESRGVITPLRHQLLQYGWSTLTVRLDYPYKANILLATDSNPDKETTTAMESVASPKDESGVTPAKLTIDNDADPSTTNETKKEEGDSSLPVSNIQRVEAAIAFLKAKGIENLILIGHGHGGLIAIKESSISPALVAGLILVGTPTLENDDEFGKISLPILDIYGDQGLQGVDAAVKARKVLMKRNKHSGYTEREIIGANHEFYGLQPLLVSTIRGWLHATFVKQEESDQ